jgi:Mg2+ and Co2+ transporter CorA
VRARLYDADGRDREVDLEPDLARSLARDQLLWVDLDRRDPEDLEQVARAVGLTDRTLARLRESADRADLTQSPDHIHLRLLAIDVEDEEGSTSAADSDASLRRHPVDIVAGRDWVLTVHEGPLPGLERFDAATEGETRLGALDASSFVAAVADEILDDYLELVESIEIEIDRLDQRALRGPTDSDVLDRIVRVRRRIGFIRRTLAPHRVAFAALARPDMALHGELGQPWPGLTERLERALEAVENLRDLLLGTFDIYMGRAAQDSNETMKVLTLTSAVLLPAVVLAGVMGMNFKLPFFDEPGNFFVVLAAMVVLAAGILIAARWRRWI